MKRFRIATLMSLILYAAIGLTVLVVPQSTRIWVSTVYTLTGFFMAIATLMAFLRRGREQAAWTGFAVFGWVYLFLLGFQDSSGFPETRLLTSWIVHELFESVRDRLRLLFWDESPFLAISHSCFTILFGWVGALLAGSFASNGESHQDSSPSHRHGVT